MREPPPPSASPPSSPRRAFGLFSLPGNLASIARGLEFTSLWRWAGLSILVGAVVGIAATVFQYSLEVTAEVLLGELARFNPPLPGGETRVLDAEPGAPRRWLLVVLPAIGGLASGLLCWKFAPDASGHGTDAMIDAYHNKGARIPIRIPIVKMFASVFTIGTGGSAGREGPISQIGAGFGSWVARILRLSDRERRLLLLAGAAAGIAALFRTPLGASIWALEILYRDDFESDGMFPCLIASVTSYSIFTSFFGQGHLFTTLPHYPFYPLQLPLYVVMAVMLAATGLLWIRLFWGMDRAFARVPLPTWARPVLGGLLLGVLGWFIPQSLGVGYGWVQEVLYPNLDARGIIPAAFKGAAFLAGIGLAKMVATSFTVGSGGSGGVFGPSIVIGGLLGGAFGLVANRIAPGIAPNPGAFALVGMGTFYAGIAHAPLASLVIVCELCGSYDLLVPLMTGIMVTYLLLRHHTIYVKQVRSPLESPAHFGEFTVDVLEDLRVEDVYDKTRGLAPVSNAMTLRSFLDHVSETAEWFFAVEDSAGKLVGVVSLSDVREVIAMPDALDLVVVGDAMLPLKTITPRRSLRTALEIFTQSGYGSLVVVDAENPHALLGVLNQSALIAAYNAEILRRRVGRPETVRLSRQQTQARPITRY